MEDENSIECSVCGEYWPEEQMELLNEDDGSYICPNCRDFESKD